MLQVLSLPMRNQQGKWPPHPWFHAQVNKWTNFQVLWLLLLCEEKFSWHLEQSKCPRSQSLWLVLCACLPSASHKTKGSPSNSPPNTELLVNRAMALTPYPYAAALAQSRDAQIRGVDPTIVHRRREDSLQCWALYREHVRAARMLI